MSFVKDIFNQLSLPLFDLPARTRLVYNICWEDPRIDRQLLQLNSNSTVVMLTSAGCNALDYLLDRPAAIYCIDTNPAQNALLQLKRSLLLNGSHHALWQMFGTGQYGEAKALYRNHLRGMLPNEARRFWDQHIEYFVPTASMPGFYYSGTAGTFAGVIHAHIKRKGLYEAAIRLINARSLAEQRYYFDEIEPQLWNASLRWFLQRDAAMKLLGVPPAQQQMIENEIEGGLLSYVRKSLRSVFTDRPVTDNYFWRVYLTGSYTQRCCPNYLAEQNFRYLQNSMDSITQHSCSLINFLDNNPGRYTHFVLLDHMDWFVNERQKMNDLWTLILSNAAPGAKVLFRSAGTSRSFLPHFAANRTTYNDGLTNKLHPNDRVGTYGSTHLATIQTPL